MFVLNVANGAPLATKNQASVSQFHSQEKLMTKKQRKSASSSAKSSVRKRMINDSSKPAEDKKFAPSDPSDQDIKRRLGNFTGAGEPHLSLKGTRGKNRKPSKKR